MKKTNWPPNVLFAGTCIRLFMMPLLFAYAGCCSSGPFAGVGAFEAAGRKSHVGDVIYGYAPEDDACSMVQYRLSADQPPFQKDLHNEFFSTNFASNCRLLDTLETNLISIAQQERSVVVVKGALYPEEGIKRDNAGRRIPKAYFAAVYDETPPEKAIVFLIPAELKEYRPLATYAFPLLDLDRHGVVVFSEIKNRETIQASFNPDMWGWHREVDGRVNRLDVHDPTSGAPVLSIFGTDLKTVSAEEAKNIDGDRYAILEIKVGGNVPSYSKDGKIKYSMGFKGGIERWHYERGPDDGPYWMYLDDEYIRMHKPGCKKFEKGRGRHCKRSEGQFGDCCGGLSYIVELRKEQERERKSKK